MFTLVEPASLDTVSDLPHLGCAMLVGACREKGIPVSLVRGQTRYLEDMFLRGGEELWGLLHDLKEEEVRRLRMEAYREAVRAKGLGGFKEELRRLYETVIVTKSARHYFNGHRIKEFVDQKNIFVSLFLYYLRGREHEGLSIIDKYVDAIVGSKPRYIGFSIENRFDPFSRAIRKRVKELTGVPIILGGALAPFVEPGELEKIWGEECMDYFVVGPAEHSLPLLVEALEDGREPEGIHNVYYKKRGELRCNPLEVVDDLNALSFPDFSQFDLPRYLIPKTILPLQTARARAIRFRRLLRSAYRAMGMPSVA